MTLYFVQELMNTMIAVVQDLASQSSAPTLAVHPTPTPLPSASEGAHPSAAPQGGAIPQMRMGDGGAMEAGKGGAGVSSEDQLSELHQRAKGAGEQIQGHNFARQFPHRLASIGRSSLRNSAN